MLQTLRVNDLRERYMYRPDVVCLKQFYASAAGQRANQLVWRRLQALWPAFRQEAVLGIGYTIPYMAADAGAQEAVVGGVPALQGALYWPQGAANRALLLDEARLPFMDNAFNRAIAVHALEHSHDPRGMLAELWRVLVPGGRVILVVPNRMGLWARFTGNPFGAGRPFSAAQLRDVVQESGLTLTRTESALFMPPSRAPWLLRMAPWVEFAGLVLAPRWGGVLVVEAEKQIYAAIKEPARLRAGAPIAAHPAPIAG